MLLLIIFLCPCVKFTFGKEVKTCFGGWMSTVWSWFSQLIKIITITTSKTIVYKSVLLWAFNYCVHNNMCYQFQSDFCRTKKYISKLENDFHSLFRLNANKLVFIFCEYNLFLTNSGQCACSCYQIFPVWTWTLYHVILHR